MSQSPNQCVKPKDLRQASYAKVAQMVGNQPVSFTNKPTAATDNISKAQIQAQRELSQNNDP